MDEDNQPKTPVDSPPRKSPQFPMERRTWSDCNGKEKNLFSL
jgi:hypothetical protein